MSEEHKDDLFAPAEGEGTQVAAQDGEGQGQQGEAAQTHEGNEGDGGTKPAAETIRGLTPEQLREIVSGAVASSRPAAQGAQATAEEAELTPEQLSKLIKFYNPDDAIVALLRHESPEEVKKALQTLADGVTQQALSVANIHIERQLKALRKQLDGELGYVRTFAKTHYEKQLADEFFTAYPMYKGMDPLIMQIKGALEAEGARFGSKKEAFKAVHDRAATILKTLKLQPGSQDGDEGEQAPVVGNTSRRMSTLSGGGQGGMGTGRANGGNAKSPGQSIWA